MKFIYKKILEILKITIRLIISLIFVVGFVAFGFTFYQVTNERIRLLNELERRCLIMAEGLHESIITLLGSKTSQKLNQIVKRFENKERLKGIIIFDRNGKILAGTEEFKGYVEPSLPKIIKIIEEKEKKGNFIKINGKKIYLYIFPLLKEEESKGFLALFYDASYISLRLKEILRDNFLRFLLLSILISIVTLLVIRWSITGPIARIAEWARDFRLGKKRFKEPLYKRGDVLAPLITEVTHLAKSLMVAREKAEAEARLRLKAESLWTSSRLKEFMRKELGQKKLFLLSNREPYMHIKEGKEISCIIPAGGLVTAIDPVMRICNGIWIAHGSGNADREVVDDDKIRVPPEEPAYTLKRIWLSKEEEDGYYYGFSNEGIWPLCHITHTRPIFRLEDWICYQKVNEKFSQVLLNEIKDEDSPLVFVQDYHLALLPLLIKEKRPDARIALFWHIPWPNPESFGICPWREEILLGMLGADLIGFHIQFFCNNFLDTIDRFLESRIDWEQFSIEKGGHTTLVRPFPISVSFEDFLNVIPQPKSKEELKKELLKELDINSKYIGVGVDRIDYTKGIPERFRAIERFFQKYPEFIEEFTFIELGAPSRVHIKRYRELLTEIDEMVDRINWSFKTRKWRPIIFLKAHHSHNEIYKFYRIADLCMVTSLHDGMNLVAKEYIASRSDEDGVLILSQFTGASRELIDALIVNPYNIEEMAEAIYIALTMQSVEKKERMKRMRETIRESNIYKWAGNLISSLVRLRTQETKESNSNS